MERFGVAGLLAAACAGLALAAAAAAASPPAGPKEQASLGDVTAAIFYTRAPNELTVSDFRIQIERAGMPVLDQPVPPYPGHSDFGLAPAGYGQQRSLFVRDLDGDGEPEVLLDLYWGGAHCCFWSRVYHYDAATNAYTVALHFWGDPSYRLKDLNGDGKPELVSADDRFAYRFTAFAFSGFPIQVWSYARGRFSNVTRRFPKEIAKDAARQWKAYLGARKQHYVRGLLAAWAADEYELGHAKAVDRALAKSLARGELKSDQDLPRDPHAYVRALKRFLRSTGYIR